MAKTHQPSPPAERRRTAKGAKSAATNAGTPPTRKRAAAMPLQVTITTVGTSAGIILPKAVLQQLKAAKGQKLFLSEAPDGSVRLSRFDPAFERQMKHAYEAMDHFPDALKELAR